MNRLSRAPLRTTSVGLTWCFRLLTTVSLVKRREPVRSGAPAGASTDTTAYLLLRSMAVRLRICLGLSFLLLTTAVTAPAAIPHEERDAIYRELQEPTRITLANGRTILGYSIEVEGDRVRIGTSKGGGEAIYTFHPDELARLETTGDSYKALAVEWMEGGETAKAMELMDLLYQQRSQALPLLSPSESHFFIYYVRLILASENPARAIGITKVIQPQIEHPAALRALEDAMLESYNRLELFKEARPLAEAWVAGREPYGASALGYYVLGSALLREEAYEAALDLALQPIVFAAPTVREKLAHCYAVAISAAFHLRDIDYAHLLYKEFKERNLTWPVDDPTFNSAFKKLQPDPDDI